MLHIYIYDTNQNHLTYLHLLWCLIVGCESRIKRILYNSQSVYIYIDTHASKFVSYFLESLAKITLIVNMYN
jgi:hypothetical protein